MAKGKKEKPINGQQRNFCKEYILHWNGSKAYRTAYPNASDNTAKVEASKLLTKPNIQEYIKELQVDLEKVAGVSRLRVLNEYVKLAFSTIADMHNTWIDRKDFDNLTDEQKACIAEIQTQVLKRNIGTQSAPEIVDVEQIRIKLYDKQRSLESIRKMLGYDEAEKFDYTSGGEPITGMIVE